MDLIIEDIAMVMVLGGDLLSDGDVLMLLLAMLEDEKAQSPVHYNYGRFDLNAWSDFECKQYFRFNRSDLERLKEVLNLPAQFKGRCGIRWHAMEGLCLVLRRLSYPNRLSDLIPMFGRSRNELGEIFNHMIGHIYDEQAFRLNELDQAWMDFELFAETVSQKGAVLKNIWGFIDGTVVGIARPKRGQESVFNGHKRKHALKYQSVMTPTGLVAHFYGPIEGRRHDSALYRLSGLEEQICDIFSSSGEQLAIYGDSAYAYRPYLITPFKGAALTELQHQFNGNMASVRAAVEWGYSKLSTIFAYLTYPKQMKALLQPVGKYYLVGALLCNAHTCLYGSQISSYFGLDPPTLEEYFS